MDHASNVVSVTQSIERSFGAKIASDRLGFLYNGYMKAFKIEDRRHPHYLRPGAVARSNASPTILFRNGRPCAAVGSTGSERMVSGIFETLARLEYRSPFDAVRSPRLHSTPEGEVLIEAERFPPGTLGALVQSGFTIRPLDSWSFSTGGLQLTTFDGTGFCGVGEPRRDGAAAGPDHC
jgi:gamma-glutamyltranspeptidase/glutathione hydrolase